MEETQDREFLSLVGGVNLVGGFVDITDGKTIMSRPYTSYEMKSGVRKLVNHRSKRLEIYIEGGEPKKGTLINFYGEKVIVPNGLDDRDYLDGATVWFSDMRPYDPTPYQFSVDPHSQAPSRDHRPSILTIVELKDGVPIRVTLPLADGEPTKRFRIVPYLRFDTGYYIEIDGHKILCLD